MDGIARTRHGLRGVTFDKQTRKWRARLYANGRHITIGRFATRALAAQAHDSAACYVFGDDALTNYGSSLARKELRRILASKQGIRYKSKLRPARNEYHRAVYAKSPFSKHRKGGAEAFWLRSHRYAASVLAGCNNTIGDKAVYLPCHPMHSVICLLITAANRC